MKEIFIFFFILISTKQVLSQVDIDPFHYTIQKKVICDHGAVVSAHPLASKAGIAMLKKGGNAVDAAIATQLALAVVYPGAGNIGGGGFMVAYLQNGKTIALDYREKAPGKAKRNMYLDSAGNANLELSQDGHLSAGVPGTIAGLFASHRYAKLPFKTLIQPAIELAENGFAITENEADALNRLKSEFLKYNTAKPAFIRNNEWKTGDTLVQKDLANTLRRIQFYGSRGFYEGKTATLIVQEMQRGNGIIGYADLRNYAAKERIPLIFNYKNFTIISMPLPSSGGILLQQMLKMLEKRNIAKMGFHSTGAVQLMTEVERRAYADRAKFLGDADFVKVPVKKLTSDSYLKIKMKDFDPGKAGKSIDELAKKTGTESEETTHLSVVDKWGNAVSVTTTLNGGYGSRTVVGGAGFLLNNEMDDFSVKPGVPNMYGAVGGEANSIVPGKRMLSSMTPTIVLKNKKPYLVLGTPGGTTIPTSVFQTILNILEFNLATEDAVNAPKFHHQWLPDEIAVENNFPEEVLNSLVRMGYKIVKREAIGRTEVIRIQHGKIEAVGDKRGEDHAEGY
jgi:gamma-glutamyltranspeptidase / glutathione hydrolase